MSRRVLEKRESMFGPEDRRTLDVLDDRSAHLSWFEKFTEVCALVTDHTRGLSLNSLAFGLLSYFKMHISHTSSF